MHRIRVLLVDSTHIQYTWWSSADGIFFSSATPRHTASVFSSIECVSAEWNLWDNIFLDCDEKGDEKIDQSNKFISGCEDVLVTTHTKIHLRPASRSSGSSKKLCCYYNCAACAVIFISRTSHVYISTRQGVRGVSYTVLCDMFSHLMGPAELLGLCFDGTMTSCLRFTIWLNWHPDNLCLSFSFCGGQYVDSIWNDNTA